METREQERIIEQAGAYYRTLVDAGIDRDTAAAEADGLMLELMGLNAHKK